MTGRMAYWHSHRIFVAPIALLKAKAFTLNVSDLVTIPKSVNIVSRPQRDTIPGIFGYVAADDDYQTLNPENRLYNF